MPDVIPTRPRDPYRWVVPAAAVVIAGMLWLAGWLILAARPTPAAPVPRIAIGRTDDGAALRVMLEGCDVTSVRRVTVRDDSGRVVWELEGLSPPSRTNFVVGQSGDPMVVTQPLIDPLDGRVEYHVDVETDRVETLAFTLRTVPPVGVLYAGAETTTEGFHAIVRRRSCQATSRLPFAGSVIAQVIVVLAGAAFAVVAAGLLNDDG